MKFRILRLIILSCLVGSSVLAASPGWRDVSEFVAYAGELRTFSWSALPDVEGYQVQVKGVDRSTETAISSEVVGTSYNWRPTRNGHYFVQVRGFWTEDGVRQYTLWCKSTDAACAVQSGNARAFNIYVMLAPPTGGIE